MNTQMQKEQNWIITDAEQSDFNISCQSHSGTTKITDGDALSQIQVQNIKQEAERQKDKIREIV